MNPSAMSVIGLARRATLFAKNNAMLILGIGAVVGVIAIVAETIRATKEAEQIVEDTQEALDHVAEQENLPAKKLTTTEKIKLTWKSYIRLSILVVVVVISIIGMVATEKTRYASMTAAYGALKLAYDQYKTRVVEHLGEDGEREHISDPIIERKMAEPKSQDIVFETGRGHALCYDTLSGRYFRSDVESIKQAVNEFNFDLVNHCAVMSLNEFYDLLGLEKTELGSSMGWDVNSQLMEIRFGAKIRNSEPCVVIEFKTSPRLL